MSIVLLVQGFYINTEAKGITPDAENGLEVVKTTAYCTGTICATGCKPRKYICAGSTEKVADATEDGSWVAMMWLIDEDGNATDFQGYYELLDAGGTDAIREGYVLDVYFPTYEECQEWMALTGGKVLVKYIYAYG